MIKVINSYYPDYAISVLSALVQLDDSFDE